MRAIAVALVLGLAACTPGADTPESGAAPPAIPTTTPGQLPAAVATGPSLSQFRREARAVCLQVSRRLAQAQLRGDPLAATAQAADVRAAVGRYRAAAHAWSSGADRLWEFGLPERQIAQRVVAALDTLALYSGQAADALDAGGGEDAQTAVGLAHDALRDANRLARRLGIEPFDECGARRRRLPDARRVRVTAHDHFFAVGEVVRGATRFVVRNEGDEAHQLFVVRLRRGTTAAEAVAADRRGEEPGPYLANRGVTSPVVRPGERTTVDTRLQPGRYALLCFVASPDGTPHAYKGMVSEIAVE